MYIDGEREREREREREIDRESDSWERSTPDDKREKEYVK